MRADVEGIADLHIHTHFSDGSDSPADVLARATQAGLDLIAITDHDTIAGAEIASELACSGDGPDVIVGEEVSSREGHILGLFLARRIPPGLGAADTIAEIHDQGGLAIAAHPFWRVGRTAHNGFAYSTGLRVEELDFDAVETLNGGVTPGMVLANDKATALARAHGLVAVGGSDAHVKEALGWGHTRFHGTSAADLRAAVVARRTRAGRSPLGLAGVRRYAAWSLGRLGTLEVAAS